MKQLFHLEDNRVARIIVKNLFKERAQVHAAANLPEASALLESMGHIDAFIIDYTLEDGTGLEFVEEIRAQPEYDAIPVILLTSTPTVDIAFKAMHYGVNETVSKVLPQDEIIDIVFRQINTPYTRLVKRQYHEVFCSAWKQNEMHYEYCPEFEKKITAPTAESARQKMQQFLEEQLRLHPEYVCKVVEMKPVNHIIDPRSK